MHRVVMQGRTALNIVISKLRALAIHFAISTLVVGTLLAVIFLIWYPSPYFEVIGVGNVVRVLIAVAVVFGPLLTFVVYKSGKPSLVFDLSVIAVIQVAAFVYGATVIFQERSYYTVFSEDRFTVQAKKDVDMSDSDVAWDQQKPFVGPLLVVASLPEDQAERERIITDVVVGSGVDVDQLPQYWVPYPDKVDAVLAVVKPLSHLETTEEATETVRRFIARHGDDPNAFGFVPIIGRKRDFAMVIERVTGMPVGVIDVNPWVFKEQ